jgi:hypothetical protein
MNIMQTTVAAALLAAFTLSAHAADSSHGTDKPAPSKDPGKLLEVFREPPVEVRPIQYCFWTNLQVIDEDIIIYLDGLKEAGFGGHRIAPGYGTPRPEMGLAPKVMETNPDYAWMGKGWHREKKKPFGTIEEWQRLINLNIKEGAKRALLIDITLWCGSSGNVPSRAREADHQLAFTTVELEGPTDFAPDSAAKPEIKIWHPNPVIKPVRFWIEGQDAAKPLSAIEPRADGTLQIPPGKHRLHIACPPPPRHNYFSAAAMKEALKGIEEKYRPFFDKRAGAPRLRGFESDSHEPIPGGQWTADFPAEFERRRGYSVWEAVPYVYLVQFDDKNHPLRDQILRHRHDYWRTVTELFHDRFTAELQDMARRNGLRMTLQSHGVVNHDWLTGAMRSDIPEAEAWIGTDGVRSPLMPWVSWTCAVQTSVSGGHLNGKPEVSSEAFTSGDHGYGDRRPRGFTMSATPEIFKAAGDSLLVLGINKFSTCCHYLAPKDYPWPGWVTWGSWMSHRAPFWPWMKQWTDYASRICAVLQKSESAEEIAIYGPTSDQLAECGVSLRTIDSHTPDLYEIGLLLRQQGFNASYINDEVLAGGKIADGVLVYGPWCRFKAVLAVNVRSMTPEALRRLLDYVKTGGRVLFIDRLPERTPGYADHQKKDGEVKQLVAEILKAGGDRVIEMPGIKMQRAFQGDPKMLHAWGVDLRAKLEAMGVAPAVEIAPTDPFLYSSRYRSGNRDIFFMTNLDAKKTQRFKASFEGIAGKTPWRWDAETGERAVFPYGGNPTELNITLEPLESLLLVFEPGKEAPGKDWHLPSGEVAAQLDGPWDVELKSVIAAPEKRTLPQLADLATVEGLRHFSGIAIYRKSFTPPKGAAFLDLGQVETVADVTLNGKRLGAKWWGHRVLDLRRALKESENTIEITVATDGWNAVQATDLWKSIVFAPRDNPYPLPAGLIGPVTLRSSQ